MNGVIDCAVFALNLTCQPIKRGKTSNAPKIFDLSFFLFSRYIRRSDSSGDLHPLPIDDNPLTFLSYYSFFFSFFLFVFMWMLLVENERHHDESIHLDVFFFVLFSWDCSLTAAWERLHLSRTAQLRTNTQSLQKTRLPC